MGYRNMIFDVMVMNMESQLTELAHERFGKPLEKCGDEGDVTKIDEQTPELLSLYSSYRDILKPLFEEKADTDLPPIDKKGLAEGYMAIKETVSAFDYDTADAIIEMLKAYSIPEDERERFTLICDSVRALDRDKTLELINS